MSKLRTKDGVPVAADFDGHEPPLVEDFSTGLLYTINESGYVAPVNGFAGDVRLFGAKGDGTTNDTAAINRAITACLTSRAPIYFPGGTYLVTSTLTTIPGSMSVIGDGSLQSTIQFAPTANDTLFYISNGAQRAAHFTMRGLRLYSSDTTYTKIAVDAEDMSVCSFEDIYVHGTGGTGAVSGVAWAGGASPSVAFRTSGREACSWRRITAFADRAIHITANPNTAANDGEDVDHWTFTDCYIGATTGNYIVYVDDGLGVISLTFDGYQAWIGGDGGFRMNDTRAAPTVSSRHIKFCNMRGEQDSTRLVIGSTSHQLCRFSNSCSRTAWAHLAQTASRSMLFNACRCRT